MEVFSDSFNFLSFSLVGVFMVYILGMLLICVWDFIIYIILSYRNVMGRFWSQEYGGEIS